MGYVTNELRIYRLDSLDASNFSKGDVCFMSTSPMKMRRDWGLARTWSVRCRTPMWSKTWTSQGLYPTDTGSVIAGAF